MVLIEEAWNSYPHCVTVIVNGYLAKHKFFICIESMHTPDHGHLGAFLLEVHIGFESSFCGILTRVTLQRRKRTQFEQERVEQAHRGTVRFS